MDVHWRSGPTVLKAEMYCLSFVSPMSGPWVTITREGWTRQPVRVRWKTARSVISYVLEVGRATTALVVASLTDLTPKTKLPPSERVSRLPGT